MGIDAMIYFKSEKDIPELSWGELIGATYKKIEPIPWVEGATHRVMLDGNDRFYGKGYERGAWPMIAGVLMDLLASPDIMKVWYGGDNEDAMVITPEEVCELSLYYMQVANAPYRGKFR